MQKKHVFAKKVYISILSTLVILTTAVATTYAWVGVLANSTFESFDVNVKASNLQEYGVELSLTGEEGTFKDSLDAIDVKKSILLNWGYDESVLKSDKDIENLFSLLQMDPVTTKPVVANEKIKQFGVFYDMYDEVNTNYFKFDIYVAVKQYYDKGSSSNDYVLDCYIKPDALQGTIKFRSLFNSFVYPSDFSNPLAGQFSADSIYKPVLAGTRIREASVDSSSSTRLGFEKYSPVRKGHPEDYEGSSPSSAIIYHNSFDYPVYDEEKDIYTFGTILKDEYNLATGYFNSTDRKYMDTKKNKIVSIPEDLYAIRGVESSLKDVYLSTNTNHLVDSSLDSEKVGIQDMMKITCYFWYEGWDSDCFNVINKAPVSVNLELSMGNYES